MWCKSTTAPTTVNGDESYQIPLNIMFEKELVSKMNLSQETCHNFYRVLLWERESTRME